MSEKLENLLNLSKEEMFLKLKETYISQKLSPIARSIARWMEILIAALFSFMCFEENETMYAVLWGVAGLYAFYRLVNSKMEDEKILEELNEVVETIENFKKYKKGEFNIKIDEKLVKKTEKGIEQNLPYLLKVSGLSRMFGLIPIVNLFVDEIYMYTDTRGALTKLWDGTLTTQGLKYYTNENIKTLQIEEGVVEI